MQRDPVTILVEMVSLMEALMLGEIAVQDHESVKSQLKALKNELMAHAPKQD